MKATTAILAAVLTAAAAATSPAYAGSPITDLADYTGLSERKVRMVLGCRTCVAEYTYTYDRSLAKFKRALGNERYQRVIDGLAIELERRPEVRVANLAERRNEDRMP